VRGTDGSPDVLELPHQALGFRVQAYGVTQQKELFTRSVLQPRGIGYSGFRQPLSSYSPPFRNKSVILTPHFSVILSVRSHTGPLDGHSQGMPPIVALHDKILLAALY
jgi:hypothetical protein